MMLHKCYIIIHQCYISAFSESISASRREAGSGLVEDRVARCVSISALREVEGAGTRCILKSMESIEESVSASRKEAGSGLVEDIGAKDVSISALRKVEGAGIVRRNVRTVSTEELSNMKLMSGDLRWLEMKGTEIQKRILLEERLLEDRYHQTKRNWLAPQKRSPGTR